MARIIPNSLGSHRLREYNHQHDPANGEFAGGTTGAGEKSVILSFGRFNPPHRGHKLLTDRMVSLAKAEGADHALYIKGRQGPKDPLSADERIDYLTKMTPGLNAQPSPANMPDPIDVMKHYSDQGYRHLTMVLGGDRVEKLQGEINDATAKGLLKFKSTRIVSAGDRSGEEMWSGTQQRDLAAKGDFAGFRAGLPPTMSVSHASGMYHKVRRGLKQFGGTVKEALREYNHQHVPGGTPAGGQFAAGSGTVESVASLEAGVRKRAMVPEEATYAHEIATAEHQILEAWQAAGGKDTKAQFTDPKTGDYTPERQRMHNQILDSLITNEYQNGHWVPRTTPLRPATDPVAILMAGMAASGKTTASKGLTFDDKVYINSDEIKAMLPGYKGSNASLFHEESSDLAKMAIDNARHQKYNMVLDSTLKSLGGTDYNSAKSDGGAAAMNERLKNSGYATEIRFTDVSVQTSLSRSINRYVNQLKMTGEGRYVPVEYIKANIDKHFGTIPRKTFESLRGHVASYVHFDNNGFGGAVMVKRRGKLTEVDVGASEGEPTPTFKSPGALAQWRGDGPETAKDKAVRTRFLKKRWARTPSVRPN